MNPNIAEMLPSTSRQRDDSSLTTINNNNSIGENNNSRNCNNHSDSHNNCSYSSFSNSSFNSSNHSNSSFSSNNFSNDEMDTQDLTPTPETRTREPSIYDWVPKSKKKQQYIYWKMLKEQESMQSCLKMFKMCNLEEDTKFKHVSSSKDSTGMRLKRKLAQNKRNRLFFGATSSSGRISQHQQSTSATFCPVHNEDLPNLPPLKTFTMLNDSDEQSYSVDGFGNNNSE